MSCRVNIKLKNSGDDNGSMVVPLTAVFEADTDNVPSVRILNKTDNDDIYTVKKQHVKLNGFVGKDNVKIVEGLKAGQKIVTAGTKRLSGNQKVKILDQKAF